jgi:hypothetical protein
MQDLDASLVNEECAAASRETYPTAVTEGLLCAYSDSWEKNTEGDGTASDF